MRDEIAAAVVFLTRVVKEDNDSANVKKHMEKFSDSLTTLLRERFKNHWYEDKPHKGQGYRCIRVNRFSPDPILLKAAQESGLKFSELQLPNELTLWVDPSEVTCRIGENSGAFCTVASFRNGKSQNQAHTVDISKMLEQHNQKRNQALSYFQQVSSSRVNANSSKDDSHPTEGHYSPFSSAKHRRHHNHHPGHWQWHHGPPPPMGGARYQKYSYHHRASPPFDMHHRASPPFLPNFHPSISNGYHEDKRHWMRGPDLVKA